MPDSDFQAWVHGPVNPQLYAKYRDHGWNDIPQREDNSALFDEKARDLLESVWLTYGDMSANALEAQTHTEEPWRAARRGVPDFENCTVTIDPALMTTYYQRVYREEQGE